MRGAGRILLAALLAALLSLATGARAQAQDFVIIFGTGASQLTPEADAVVKLVAERAGEQHPASIAVAGYGDADNGEDSALAEKRAQAVIHALTEAGVSPGLIKEVPRAPPAAATGIPVHKVTVTFTR
jgi:outer membrane protein OmpA-like peptidoglycan-associated protein